MLRLIARFFPLLLLFDLANGPAGFSATIPPTTGIANPASVNCIKAGGRLILQRRGDGGEYGLCLFEDNRQCEEWALFRGECPVGGLRITGYVTSAARYCAVTGGNYRITGNSNTDQEQGTCTFRNGRICDVWDLDRGKCQPNPGPEPLPAADPFAYCAAVGTIARPAGFAQDTGMPEPIIQAMIGAGLVAADTPPAFQNNAVWRCMNNSVWVCLFGANLPCLEKADLTKEPGPEEEEFCRTNPAAAIIPAAVTGRATVYEWGCRGGKPEVVRQLFRSDPEGYLADFWYQLPGE